MSNDIVVHEDPGAGREGPATDSHAGGVGGAGLASSPVADLARMAEIDAIMRTDFSRYEREGLDREMLALMQAQIEADNPDAGTPTVPMAVDMSRSVMQQTAEGRRLVDEWTKWGGFGPRLGIAQKHAGEIVRAIGGTREQRVFLENFGRDVPEAARIEVYSELSAGPPTFVTQASPQEVSLFAKTPVGKALVAEWGPNAADHVAVLRFRAERLMGAIYEDEADTFWDWLEGLDSKVVATIFKKMAAH